MSFHISHTCKMLLAVLWGLGIAVLAAGMFFAENKLLWVLGIALGTAVSAVKVILLEKTLEKAVDMDSKNANNYTRANYTLRLVLTVAVVMAACYTKQVSVVGVIIGLLLVQPAAYITNAVWGKGEKV